MSINIGDRFGEFTVVRTAKEAITRWSCFHQTCNLYNTMQDNFEKNILGACIDDEYAEMTQDQYIMGVGLWAYNQSLRRA